MRSFVFEKRIIYEYYTLQYIRDGGVLIQKETGNGAPQKKAIFLRFVLDFVVIKVRILKSV